MRRASFREWSCTLQKEDENRILMWNLQFKGVETNSMWAKLNIFIASSLYSLYWIHFLFMPSIVYFCLSQLHCIFQSNAFNQEMILHLIVGIGWSFHLFWCPTLSNFYKICWNLVSFIKYFETLFSKHLQRFKLPNFLNSI